MKTSTLNFQTESENLPGVKYNTTCTTKDGYCEDCGGSGKRHFSTPQDIAKHDALMERWLDDLEADENDEPKLERSGERVCETCKGSGEGDGHSVEVVYKT